MAVCNVLAGEVQLSNCKSMPLRTRSTLKFGHRAFGPSRMAMRLFAGFSRLRLCAASGKKRPREPERRGPGTDSGHACVCAVPVRCARETLAEWLRSSLEPGRCSLARDHPVLK
eukprot:5388403-Prymnesium_polylepis.1